MASSKPTRSVQQVRMSTIISITLVLLMLGMLGLIVLNAKYLSDYVKENITVSVIVNDNTKEVDILQLEKTIKAIPIVKSTQYITKDMAASNLSKELGEDFVKFLGYNPLLSSIDVQLKAENANNAGLILLESKLKSNKIVKELYFQPTLIDSVNSNLRIIGLILIAFVAVLLIVAIALINNTIQIAMYAQRFLIKSMQLVGATNQYIRKPFILAAVLQGIIGGLIAVIMVLGILFIAQKQLPELVFLQNYTEFSILFVLVICLGLALSVGSTILAVNKYLKRKMYELY